MPSTRGDAGPGLESGFESGLGTGLEICTASGFGAADGLDFNCLDAGLWDALATTLLVAVLDFFATALRVFAAGVLTGAFEPPPAAFAGAVVRDWVLEDPFAGPLEDFLRVFLDIRLPFVAFGGSTNRVLRVSSRRAGFAPAAGQV